ncbi:esterase family protein [Actinoplanes sp. L3-i22]|uniref:alpha/beta hydrolase n=1 Tax=Actinoplanes sp. L3-i22 TaxID=2836373 RepID=UPI001C743FC5|nr:alpha/beta hydrolase-fold protein [Actinoplanes sp. L3-i22]BCY11454.1 esterase [Actinoplanes sp. L3-i22]
MDLDSVGTEWTAVAVAVVAVVGFSLVWGTGRVLVRTVAGFVCVLSAAAAGLTWVNRQVDAYPTWSSLVGSSAAADTPVTAGRVGAGQIVTLTVNGQASGLNLPVYAYLPPGYSDTGSTRYPVVEALHGYPGSPSHWIKRLDVATVLNHEIRAGRMAPTVVLFPYQTPDPLIDTECANLVGGAQAETFLTRDVPAAARARFQVRTDAAGWGLIGYSAGGYCATDLALRHPDEYTAAASLSGDATPGIKIGDGSENTTYNDLWRLAHLPVPAVSLYLASARTDRTPLRDTRALVRAARAPLSVTTSYIDGGGHNVQTWQAMEAPAFDWLSTQLARPLP